MPLFVHHKRVWKRLPDDGEFRDWLAEAERLARSLGASSFSKCSKNGIQMQLFGEDVIYTFDMTPRGDLYNRQVRFISDSTNGVGDVVESAELPTLKGGWREIKNEEERKNELPEGPDGSGAGAGSAPKAAAGAAAGPVSKSIVIDLTKFDPNAIDLSLDDSGDEASKPEVEPRQPKRAKAVSNILDLTQD